MTTRINLDMTTIEIAMALSDGNPGAVNVIAQILKNGTEIDPDSMFGGMGALLYLDTYGLYGPDIWILYKDVCGENLARVIALLRATQMGIIGKGALLGAIASPNSLEVDSVIAKVKEKLPNLKVEVTS